MLDPCTFISLPFTAMTTELSRSTNHLLSWLTSSNQTVSLCNRPRHIDDLFYFHRRHNIELWMSQDHGAASPLQNSLHTQTTTVAVGHFIPVLEMYM